MIFETFVIYVLNCLLLTFNLEGVLKKLSF